MARPGKILRGAQWGPRLAAAMAEAPAASVSWLEQHTRLLKSDRYSRVGLLELEGAPCFLKLYLAKSPVQKLGFRLGYGRGLRSFDAATSMAEAGLPVPEPRACLLVPEGMVLLTEALAGGADLRALWLDLPAADDAERLMHGAGAALARLHGAGYAHGDCKWSNLLWCARGMYFVDLEVVRKPRAAGTLPLAGQLRDLARFIVDAEELGASAPQFEIFMGSYLAGVPCRRERLVSQVRPLLTPIRERHQRRYRQAPRPLI
ncbi:MAG: hypothetical protein H6988_02740 [Pseudomonadales bacterium]|nr:hypothetical protein [Halieaceae bacterium]MCP5163665.1 hypothetical protein [Pseudomonadales bacterium]MCP5189289.1 hypothetical protein [Pseudomonadales bacterium]MCP5204451.1 hypothetical protein [Pseudomonadales bacterium]